MTDSKAMQQLMDRINTGAAVPPTDPAQLRRMVELRSAMPADKRTTTAIGLGAVAGANGAAELSPEAMVGLMMRSAVAESLIGRGLFKAELSSNPDALYASLATLPMSKDDFVEASASLLLALLPANEAGKLRDELTASGRNMREPALVHRIREQL